MTTLLAVTLLTITAATMPGQETSPGFSKDSSSTVATALPTPGAGVLIAIGGVALLRARRDKR